MNTRLDKLPKPWFDEFLAGVSAKDVPRVKRWFKLVRKLGDRAPTLTYQTRH